MYDSEVDKLNIVQFAFAAVHVLYFFVYYGRYSTLNQKLANMDKMEKSGLVEQELIDASRASILSKLSALRKVSLYPVAVVAVAHLIVLVSFMPNRLYFNPSDHYLHLVYITGGSFALILVGNFVKGAQIFDPNKRFRGTTGRP